MMCGESKNDYFRQCRKGPLTILYNNMHIGEVQSDNVVEENNDRVCWNLEMQIEEK